MTSASKIARIALLALLFALLVVPSMGVAADDGVPPTAEEAIGENPMVLPFLGLPRILVIAAIVVVCSVVAGFLLGWF